MKKPKIKNVVETVKTTFEKRSPEILTGIGIAGMITTTVMAVRATPKAILILNEEECRRSKMDEPTSINKRDTIKLTWKCYIPSCIIGTISISCLVGASSVNAKRNAALATAYSLSESILKDYQEKVIEVIGEKKERSIRDAVAKDKINQNPVSSQSIIITNKGDTLCYDTMSGRYFNFDIDKLRKIENSLNRQMLDEGYISLNDFYYEVGLESIPLGDELGWNIEDCMIELDFSSQLAEDNVPCLVISYKVEPKHNFYKINK